MLTELHDDAVAAREDVEIVEIETVGDLRLWDEPANLAPDRGEGRCR